MIYPCKDCEDRQLGCHSRCDKYKAYKHLMEDRKRKIKKARPVWKKWKRTLSRAPKGFERGKK